MVLYFSGTGNSRYTAQVIGKATDDQVVSMNELIKKGSTAALASDRPFVFVAPVHGWRIPKAVETFILETPLKGNKQAYFVMTCGDSAGNAVHYLRKLCMEKSFDFMGLASIIMPENYIAVFPFAVPDKTKACSIIKQAEPHIRSAAECIKNGKPLPEEKTSVSGWLRSTIANPVFRSLIISDKGFYATELCIGCGKCAGLCPVNNIHLVNRKPVWDGNCTHCMACICGCPGEAIEYKKKTQGKPRYSVPEEP